MKELFLILLLFGPGTATFRGIECHYSTRLSVTSTTRILTTTSTSAVGSFMDTTYINGANVTNVPTPPLQTTATATLPTVSTFGPKSPNSDQTKTTTKLTTDASPATTTSESTPPPSVPLSKEVFTERHRIATTGRTTKMPTMTTKIATPSTTPMTETTRQEKTTTRLTKSPTTAKKRSSLKSTSAASESSTVTSKFTSTSTLEEESPVKSDTSTETTSTSISSSSASNRITSTPRTTIALTRASRKDSTAVASTTRSSSASSEQSETITKETPTTTRTQNLDTTDSAATASSMKTSSTSTKKSAMTTTKLFTSTNGQIEGLFSERTSQSIVISSTPVRMPTVPEVERDQTTSATAETTTRAPLTTASTTHVTESKTSTAMAVTTPSPAGTTPSEKDTTPTASTITISQAHRSTATDKLSTTDSVEKVPTSLLFKILSTSSKRVPTTGINTETTTKMLVTYMASQSTHITTTYATEEESSVEITAETTTTSVTTTTSEKNAQSTQITTAEVIEDKSSVKTTAETTFDTSSPATTTKELLSTLISTGKTTETSSTQNISSVGSITASTSRGMGTAHTGRTVESESSSPTSKTTPASSTTTTRYVKSSTRAPTNPNEFDTTSRLKSTSDQGILSSTNTDRVDTTTSAPTTATAENGATTSNERLTAGEKLTIGTAPTTQVKVQSTLKTTPASESSVGTTIEMSSTTPATDDLSTTSKVEEKKTTDHVTSEKVKSTVTEKKTTVIDRHTVPQETEQGTKEMDLSKSTPTVGTTGGKMETLSEKEIPVMDVSKSNATLEAEIIGMGTTEENEQTVIEASKSTATVQSETRKMETTERNGHTATEKAPTTVKVETTGTSAGKDTTVTEATSSSVVHYEDLGEDEASTAVPDHCSLPCPEGWTEGSSHCFRIAHSEKSTTYAKAISHCQALFPHQSNLASADDFQDLDNLNLFKKMISERMKMRKKDWFWINMLASRKFRSSLKADIISLEQVNRVALHVVQSVGSTEEIEDVYALCRMPRYCSPNTCQFKQFVDEDKDSVVELPLKNELIAGQSLSLPCIEFGVTGQTHLVRCQSIGEFGLHPSMITCKKPEDHEDEEVDTVLNPSFPWSCSQCYDAGTDTCVENTDAPGIVCRCKQGWTMRTCWQSPNYCAKDACGPHGTCVSLGDRFECVCEEGMIGDHCQINATLITAFGTNGTVSLLNMRSLGVAAQLSTNVVILAIKWVTQTMKTGEGGDPQDTYIIYRLAVQSVANLATFLYTHPGFMGVDLLACRFYYWLIAASYTCGLMLLTNEAANCMQVIRAVHRNTWNVDMSGNHQRHMRFIIRVTIPFFGTIFFILALLTYGWEEATDAFSCFGTFRSTRVKAWLPLLFVNGAVTILALSFVEGSFLLKWNRPHTLVRLHNWYDKNAPSKREEVNKVERNLYLLPWGIVLHFMTWGSLTFSNNRDTTFSNTITFVFTTAYSLFNLLQLVLTDPDIYGKACVKAMTYLPKRFSPTFEWIGLRTREEVLAVENPKRLIKEEELAIRDEDERTTVERERIEKINKERCTKWPGLPARLLLHVIEDGPAVSYPRPFPFPASTKDYMTAFEREHLARFWTRSYLSARAFHKETPEYCAMTVIKEEIRRQIFRRKSEERRKQELFALATWWNSVPAMDRTVLDAHDKTVIMEDPNETPLLAFDRAVLKLASIIDLRANRERKALLDDPSTADFEKTSEFLAYEPRAPIRCVTWQSLDAYGDPCEREFIKNPELVLERQVAAFEGYYLPGVAELNKSFDKCYDDDLAYTQWVGTKYKNAAHAILSVQRSRIGKQRISQNPRKRPLDSFWLDNERPDFIGPRQEADGRVPIGPYEAVARKLQYFQALTDAQWAQISHNAYHLENLKKIRRGEL